MGQKIRIRAIEPEEKNLRRMIKGWRQKRTIESLSETATVIHYFSITQYQTKSIFF